MEVRDLDEAGPLNLIDNHVDKITVEYLQQKFPKKKNTITEETVELIQATMEDPLFNGYNMIDAMMDYEKAMYDGKASINDYINAIKFCSYLEGDNSTIIDAFKYTFSRNDFVRERMNDASGTTGYNELSTAASRYRKRPLVKTILTRANMSLYLMFQRETYDAVKVLSKEMHEADYAKDRIAAADKLLTHVKAPEEMTVDLNVGHGEDAQSAMDKMFAQIALSAIASKKQLEAGADLSSVQKIGVNVNSEPDEVIDTEIERKST